MSQKIFVAGSAWLEMAGEEEGGSLDCTACSLAWRLVTHIIIIQTLLGLEQPFNNVQLFSTPGEFVL
jgi:hypothetical protein